jgi:CubicO group peptidase (beta-lactamase class C family)
MAEAQSFEHRLTPLVHLEGAPERATLAERMAYYRVPGVSIALVHEGRIAWARAWGAISADPSAARVSSETVFEAASISKVVTDFAVMRLVERGELDIDAPVDRYLERWRLELTATTTPTLRMIMAHRAGFNVPSVPGYPASGPVPSLLEVLRGDPPSATPKVRVVGRPGERFQYSGGGLAVVQEALIETAGAEFDAAMRTLVLGPMGMDRSTFSQPPELGGDRARGHDIFGRPYAQERRYPEMSAAGLHTTASDLARIILEIQRAAQGRSELLSRASARAMLTRQGGGPTGLGFFLSGEGSDLSFGHDGWNYGFTSKMIGYVERGEGAIVMTNGDAGALMYEVIAALAEAYHWPRASAHPIEARAIDPATAQRLAGTYAWDGGSTVKIACDGARLFISPSPSDEDAMGAFPPQELYAAPDGGVFTALPRIDMRFEIGDAGRVVALVHGSSRGARLP